MIQKTEKIKGRSLQARDGKIGEVTDVYFDDHYWHVRYLVVETGAWLKKRKVLISPEMFRPRDGDAKTIPVDLTMEQVRSSPSIDTDKPISRQQEETLRQYYGWPPYWGGVAGGGIGIPVIAPIPAGNTSEPGYTDGDLPLKKGDPYLRSVNDTVGYRIAAVDGEIGHLEDFLSDDEVWRIRYLLIDTRNWLPGKEVIIAPDWIREIRWETKMVYVDLTRDQIKGSPPFDSLSPWNSAYAANLHDYYGRPRYSDWDRDITAGAPPLRRDR